MAIGRRADPVADVRKGTANTTSLGETACEEGAGRPRARPRRRALQATSDKTRRPEHERQPSARQGAVVPSRPLEPAWQREAKPGEQAGDEEHTQEHHTRGRPTARSAHGAGTRPSGSTRPTRRAAKGWHGHARCVDPRPRRSARGARAACDERRSARARVRGDADVPRAEAAEEQRDDDNQCGEDRPEHPR